MPNVLLGGLIINEILVDPSGAGASYDTDQDGTVNHTDEYVEIYNSSDAPIDISGLELWDPTKDNWFTFPPGSILGPGGHAIVVTGFQGGPGPTVNAGDLVFDAGQGSAVLNNGAEQVVLYDPSSDEYISAHYNGATPVDPAAVTDFDGFSTTATEVGTSEDFGNDVDGYSMQRGPDGSDVIVNGAGPTAGVTNICFAAGTQIATPDGPKSVEDFRPGDLVTVEDGSAKPLLWVGSRHFDGAALVHAPALCPIEISPGALGPGQPAQTLTVSRQHRLVVRSRISKRMTDTDAVLIAAKDLLSMPGIVLVAPTEGITYCHLLLDKHHILMANDAPAESLYLGTEGMKAMTPQARAEISQIFPELADVTCNWEVALPVLRGAKARNLTKRHLKNNRPLLEA